MFQMTFAILTPALMCGAFAERMKFSALFLFMVLWSLFCYVPICHWVWGLDGWLAAAGALDYAGGTVVHINAGVAGLVACLMLGKRIGYGKEAMAPHNLILARSVPASCGSAGSDLTADPAWPLTAVL